MTLRQEGLFSAQRLTLFFLVCLACFQFTASRQEVSAQQSTPEEGWIALIADSGNIHLISPTSSDTVPLTLDASPESPYERPRWAHDGTALAFSGPQGETGIWLWRDGQLSNIPGTEGCQYPAFTAANDQIVASCGVGRDIVVIALDGSTVNDVVPSLAEAVGGLSVDPDPGLVQPVDLDVRSSDGALIIATSDGVRHLLDSSFALVDSISLAEGYGGLAITDLGLAKFSPIDGEILAVVCVSACEAPDQAVHAGITATDTGMPLLQWSPDSPGLLGRGMDLSPDGAQGVMGYIDASGTSQLGIMPQAGLWTPLGTGTFPVWQPETVALYFPTSDTDQDQPTEQSGVDPTLDSQASAVGMVAFIGNDGHIWTATAEGDELIQATGAPVAAGDGRLVLSPDARFVAQAGVPVVTPPGAQAELAEPIKLWNLSDGTVTELPNSSACFAPEFSSDSSRVSYKCSPEMIQYGFQPDGLVLSSAIDGTDLRVETPMPEYFPGIVMDVRTPDGALLISYMRDTNEGQGSLPATILLDASLAEIGSFEGVEIPEWGPQALFDTRFTLNGQAIVANVCIDGCIYNQETVSATHVISLDGEIIEQLEPQWLSAIGGSRLSLVNMASNASTPDQPLIESTGDKATTPPPLDSVAEPDPPGWIAYSESGIWIMRPDGSERTQIMEAPSSGLWSDAGHISWSHDGTMLAFNGPTGLDTSLDEVRGIWIYRDGQAYHLPNTESCAYPAFSADNQRVLYTCWGATLSNTPDEQLANDPQMGFLSSSALDGSDQRVEISYLDASPVGTWTDVRGAYLQGESVAVNPVDGSVLVSYTGETEQPEQVLSGGGVMLFDPSMSPVLYESTVVDEGVEINSGLFPIFLPDHGVAKWNICLNVCANGEQFLATNLDGNEIVDPVLQRTVGSSTDWSLSPDGQSVIYWTGADGTAIYSPIGTSGSYSSMEQKLAWQPVPVRVSRPTGPPVFIEAETSNPEEGAADAFPSTTGDNPGVASEDTFPLESDDTALELPLGAGWVASIAPEGGELGGAVLLTRPDGSEQVKLTDSLPFYEFQYPIWSNDGSMLAFAGPTFLANDLIPYSGIWVFKDGQLTHFENTEFCMDPVFSADSQRVYYYCWAVGYTDISPADLATDPKLAMVASSAIDGSDQRIEVAFTDTPPIGSYTDPATGQPRAVSDLAADPERAYTLVVANDHVFVFDAEFALVATGERCPGGCPNGQAVELVGLDGNPFDYPGLDSLLTQNQGLTPYQIVAEQPVPVEILMPGEAPPPADTSDDSTTSEDAAPAIENADSSNLDDAVASTDLPLGAGWIAATSTTYEDPAAITLYRPDLSEQVVFLTSSDFGGNPMNLVWSHDGTILAFNGSTAPVPENEGTRGIWIIQNGRATMLSNTEGCSMPAFSADSARLLYICPDNAHFDKPTEAIIPEDALDAPATARYFPVNSYLGTIRSSAIDGSDQQIEIEYNGVQADPAWGNLSGVLMIQEMKVSPRDGTVLVVYRDVYSPSIVAGGLLFDSQFELIERIDNTEDVAYPVMLHDGTVVLPTFCSDGLCPSGFRTELVGLDGLVVDNPAASMVIESSAEYAFSPDGTQGVGWTYHDGLQIMDATGTVALVKHSANDPAWQPVPVEIALPAA